MRHRTYLVRYCEKLWRVGGGKRIAVIKNKTGSPCTSFPFARFVSVMADYPSLISWQPLRRLRGVSRPEALRFRMTLRFLGGLVLHTADHVSDPPKYEVCISSSHGASYGGPIRLDSAPARSRVHLDWFSNQRYLADTELWQVDLRYSAGQGLDARPFRPSSSKQLVDVVSIPLSSPKPPG